MVRRSCRGSHGAERAPDRTPLPEHLVEEPPMSCHARRAARHLHLHGPEPTELRPGRGQQGQREALKRADLAGGQGTEPAQWLQGRAHRQGGRPAAGRRGGGHAPRGRVRPRLPAQECRRARAGPPDGAGVLEERGAGDPDRRARRPGERRPVRELGGGRAARGGGAGPTGWARTPRPPSCSSSAPRPAATG